MPEGEDWISAAIAQLQGEAPLVSELKPALEKLLRENLSSEPLNQGQLRAIAMRLTKFAEPAEDRGK